MSALLLLGAATARAAEPRGTPEERALAFLVREVPRWPREHKCFSCHNNGDAARALYTARRLGYQVPAEALEKTSAWLARPGEWDHNGGEEYSDKKVARLLFAATLVEAMDAGLVKENGPLQQAAEMIVEHQQKDGSWQVDTSSPVGSPATHGDAVATWFTRRTLYRADARRYRDAIRRADEWLNSLPIRTVPAAAVALLALERREDEAATARRKQCLELLQRAQSKDGGWGPYVTSPSEPFDTALTLLALVQASDQPAVKTMVQRGRAYLIAVQQRDGHWVETTRPPGAQSYAQRLSTTGWATLALLATRAK